MRRRKFRRKKFLGTFSSLDESDILNLVLEKHPPENIRERLADMSEAELFELFGSAISWSPYQILKFQIVQSLLLKATKQLSSISQDFKEFSHHGLEIDSHALQTAIERNLSDIHGVYSRIVSAPQVMTVNPKSFSDLQKYLAKYQKQFPVNSRDGRITDIREEIKFKTYSNIGQIKNICEVLFGKRDGQILAKKFVINNILKDVQLSNFLRGGKKKTSITYEEFKEIRRDFLKRFREKMKRPRIGSKK